MGERKGFLAFLRARARKIARKGRGLEGSLESTEENNCANECKDPKQCTGKVLENAVVSFWNLEKTYVSTDRFFDTP